MDGGELGGGVLGFGMRQGKQAKANEKGRISHGSTSWELYPFFGDLVGAEDYASGLTKAGKGARATAGMHHRSGRGVSAAVGSLRRHEYQCGRLS
jgi:hypothetical protein